MVARRIILIGCILGFVSLALFAGLHALVVKPVWTQLAQGIPFVIAIGVSVSWAYHEFVKSVPKRVCAAGGLRFGALIWLSALPATALANIVRVRTGTSLPLWVDLTALALSLAGGALALWLVTRSRRAAISGAVAATVLLALAGGPLPVIRGGRVVELWVSLLVLETVGGAVLAWLYRRYVSPVAASPLTPA
jgi:hypothetical protein